MSVYRTDAASLGRPFGRDYAPATLGFAPDPAVRRAVARQAAELARTSQDPGVRGRGDAIRERVRGRWSRGDRRIDVVRDPRDGEKALVVGGEVLVSASSWPDVADEAQRDGLTRVEVGCPDLEDRVVRLRTDGEDATQRLTRFVHDLREQGHAVSFSYVTPLAPVMKGCSGVPAPGLATFADYGPVDPSFGRGVRVAVIDTGIVETPRGDGWLAGVARVPAGPGATDGNVDVLDADPADGFLDVSAGHGTFVAGVIAQVAPGAEITAHRALSTSGTATDIEVACALIRAVRENAQVVNLSLGTETYFDEPPLALAAALDVVREIEMARGWETVLVAAGGNGGTTSPVWPAAFGRVVAVGGLTAGLRPTTWSSRGHWIDASTVGEGVVSTYVAGTQSPDLAAEPQTFGADAWARWTGSSFAAPQFTGAVARAMTEHSLSGTQAVRELLAAGRPVAGFGKALQILPGA